MNDERPDERSGNDRDHELENLLQAWHREVDDRAREARQRILSSVSDEADVLHPGSLLRRLLMNRYLPYAALIVLTAILAVHAIPDLTRSAVAQDRIVQLPEGGRLDAFDADGLEIGPCSLRHTDVDITVSGHFVRADVDQVFTNTYDVPIEAVYVFPLSHRGAVDRMTMTVRSGDEIRIIEGEIEERDRARRIYEEARLAGHVASLLEQERPNIFTQSVANIEPGAEITISISYVETLEEIDGTYRIVFPTVVGPRYIPGYADEGVELPVGCVARRGIVLRGPADLVIDEPGTAGANDLALIEGSTPIDRPAWADEEGGPEALKRFKVSYADGSRERVALFENNTGVVGGRWFCWQPPLPGEPFASDTDQVPDASRITPMPVRPGTRTGHDLSISVEIETGGAPIATVEAPLHEIVEVAPEAGRGSKGRKVIELASRREIPNRDFILEWTLGGDGIRESVLTHAKNPGTAHTIDGPEEGVTVVDGHIAVILNPPDRVEDSAVPARELVFVLDTSGSMRGFPIEKAKAVMTRAIDAMRAEDTFNLITFAGDTHILWDEPRPATEENRRIASDFIESRRGGGGTEMMKAIDAALTRTPAEDRTLEVVDLVNLPADGREVRVRLPFGAYSERALEVNPDVRFGIETTIAIPARPESMAGGLIHAELPVEIDGRWSTREGRRVLVVENARFFDGESVRDDPMRIVVFMTDGYVGNDQAILASIRRNAATTRVFSFGIGNSVNRYLLDGMAEAGRGAVEYVTLVDRSADEAVARFARRIQTPVLIDISMEVDGVVLHDVLPSADHLPDLYDEKPIIILARYQVPGKGSITLNGRTGDGPWSRTIDLDLRAEAPDNDVIATLWAREKVDDVLAPHLAELQAGAVDVAVREEVIALGMEYSIMTPFTSFVAVEKTRVVSDGRPLLVRVPIELPDGTDWAGFFGDPNADPVDVRLESLTLGRPPQAGLETLGEPADLELAQEGALGLAPPPPPASGSRLNFGRSTDLAYGVAAPMPKNAATRGRSAGGGRGGRGSRGGAPAVIGGGGGGADAGRSRSSERWFADESVAPTAEGTVVGDTGEEAAEVGLLSESEIGRLVRILDRPLFRLALRALLVENGRGDDVTLVAEERHLENGLVQIAIRVGSADPDTIRALEAAGLRIIARNTTTGVVVGTSTPRALIEIANVPGVVRVIPTGIEPAPEG